MNYAGRTKRPPRILTDDEQRRILRVTGEHVDGFRDHVILSIALSTGMRESEIVALNVGDVRKKDGGVRRTVYLREFKRAGAGADPEDQKVTFSDSTFYKLEKYLRTKRRHAEDGDALFPSRQSARMSTRRIRSMFRHWQEVAQFDRPYHFHSLRHKAITTVRKESGDITIAKRFARHRHSQTTEIYNHVSDQEVLDAVKDLKT